jgi:hypothetical protein
MKADRKNSLFDPNQIALARQTRAAEAAGGHLLARFLFREAFRLLPSRLATYLSRLGQSTIVCTIVLMWPAGKSANVLILGYVGHLRIILLIANAVLFVWLAYIVATDPEPTTDPQFVLACGVLTLLALNFFYVLLANRPFNWRAFRLIGLWFDATKALMRRG